MRRAWCYFNKSRTAFSSSSPLPASGSRLEEEKDILYGAL